VSDQAHGTAGFHPGGNRPEGYLRRGFFADFRPGSDKLKRSGTRPRRRRRLQTPRRGPAPRPDRAWPVCPVRRVVPGDEAAARPVPARHVRRRRPVRGRRAGQAVAGLHGGTHAGVEGPRGRTGDGVKADPSQPSGFPAPAGDRQGCLAAPSDAVTSNPRNPRACETVPAQGLLAARDVRTQARRPGTASR
jgi:hypothetical protein